MDVSRRRPGVKTSVAAGSVWESRMKVDEVKGGIKVFNGEENHEVQNGDIVPRKLANKGQSSAASSAAMSGKRKTWKSESFGRPIQIAKGKTEPSSNKNCEEQCRELSVSADGIKKSPIQARKGRSEGSKELSLSVDGIDKSPILEAKKGRSEASKVVGVSVDGNEKSASQKRKPRSDIKEVVESEVQLSNAKLNSVQVTNQSAGKDVEVENSEIERNSVQLRKDNSETDKVVHESVKANGDESIHGIENSPPEVEESGSEETCKEFGVCQDKVISSSETNENAIVVKSPPHNTLNEEAIVVKLPPNNTLLVDGHDDHDDVVIEDEGDDGEDVDEEIDIEIEKKSLVIKEINIPEEKPKTVEISIPEQKHKPKKADISTPQQKPKKAVVNEERKVHHFRDKTAPTSSIVNKQPPPVISRATIYQNLSKSLPTPFANQYQSFPETHNRLQNLVDLVMWRDISRSAFVFGMGTFIIASSSYTKDLNVSFISVISYLGLIYLATIFLYRSLICRGVIYMDDDDRSYVLGENEAIWLMKLVLPYLNEFLLKIRALFSGDPSTTMKMAVVLFVLARCGSSITIWKMAKLGFFGVFTVPKVCSLYSSQLTAYAKFWIRRFRDAWDSCSHKKAVALAIFTLVWNLSSMVARIWAVFMMFVAVRYYQQTIERDDWVEDDAEDDETWHGDIGGQRQGCGPTSVEVNKVKKDS